jgi:ABC-type transport system involved in cytochrome c biogenesis permease component
MNMTFFKNLSHEAKVALSVIGSAVTVLVSNPDLLTPLLTQPLATSLPVVIPKIAAMGALGGALYNMTPNKTPKV